MKNDYVYSRYTVDQTIFLLELLFQMRMMGPGYHMILSTRTRGWEFASTR